MGVIAWVNALDCQVEIAFLLKSFERSRTANVSEKGLQGFQIDLLIRYGYQ
jgi:hypothetical protein